MTERNAKVRQRRLAMAAAFALLAGWSSAAFGQSAPATFPATAWETADPSGARWSAQKLAQAQFHVSTYTPTAVVVVQDGKIVAVWGDGARKANVRSVRKSLLSALYGIAVAKGEIRLDQTLGELGVDDRPPSLTEIEKQATVRDLLMARSGIYHPAAYESREMAAKRPARGSHRPGSFWYYNNWDFNALGTIYAKLVGKNVFESFDERIARPLAMQDFAATDGRFVFERSSDHPAYTMRLTARDLARVGWLFFNGGAWAGRQVVPADWVRVSTSALSDDGEGWGYGYLWWTISADMAREQPRLAGAYMALGYGGQALAVIPRLRVVVAQVTDVAEGKEWIRGATFPHLLRLIADAALP